PPDQAPTRRVTAEELRQAAAAQQASYDLPTGMLSPEDIPTRNRFPAGDQPGADAGRPAATAPVADGDIPTQRVRPQDLAEYVRGPQPGRPAQPGHVPQPYPPQQAAFEQTPHVRQPAPPPYSYPQQPQAPVSPHPGQRPGHMLQRSKAYGVASGMIMIVAAVAAVLAPIVVAAVVIPAAILLRAADIAQPRLNTRRAAGEAAADVFRVFGQPAALLKSVGITVALVPYALILGLPVTLLLTVVAAKMPPANALSWGTAVALWTVCAGPGVEGPGRQMRRTLASMLPSRSAAMIVASVLGALAALMILIAIGTVGDGARQARWAPVDVGTVVTELTDLRKAAR
ncbi:hypothetical protein AB0J28_44600, partial [Streptosporangium canum]